MIWARIFAVLLLTLAASSLPRATDAHALEPGYLEISPIGSDSWRIFWRRPDVSGRPMAIDVRLPEACTPRTGPAPASDGRAWVTSWLATCPGGLFGGEIMIDGLSATRTDVLVRAQTPSGRTMTERLTPDRPAFQLPENAGPWNVLTTYVPLGVEHILIGPDHLLFVFALLLLIRGRGRLLGAITAFTVAHSLTMAIATLDIVHLPGPPVEAVIALSIMFLASELAHRDPARQRLSERAPWAVSFSFGLLHGFGFAGALREIGLPPDEVPLALLSFNVGVEIGQLLFVAVIALIALVLARLAPNVRKGIDVPHSPVSTVLTYGIGGVSAYWFIDRVAGFI